MLDGDVSQNPGEEVTMASIHQRILYHMLGLLHVHHLPLECLVPKHQAGDL